MSLDPHLLRSMAAAVQNAPGDQALRLHLARMLLDAGRPQSSLDHCIAILTNAPNHPQALGLASAAAAAAGEYGIAASYEDRLRRLADPSATEPSEDEFRKLMDGYEGPSEDESPDELMPPADRPDIGEVEVPRITLEDVGGMKEVKKKLNAAFLAPLRNPELRKAFGKSLRGGLLLYGPPGCGKTFIAKALAGELGANFFAIGLSDVLDMWLGNSEKNLHQIFETARKAAPCVLFLDEVDALGQKRSHLRHSAGRGVVNQLLMEMDGTQSHNEGVFVLAASNHPWDIDTALRRPGRLDRTVLVLPPDEPARQAILAYHLRNRPTAGVDVARIAWQTNDFSGADLAFLCEAATEQAFEDSIETGKIRPVTMQDFTKALRDVRPSTNEWLETAKNYAIFSNDSGTYDDLIAYLRQRKML